MDIIRLAIKKPVGVTVGVLLLVIFGLIGVGAIPVQLTPTVDYPIINVETRWSGRSPQEIIDEITKEQEEKLKNVSELKSMRSLTSEGVSQITLEFYLGSNINRARQEVSDALRQVPEIPADANEPTITVAGTTGPDSAIAWMIVDLDPAYVGEHPDFDISTLYDAVDREIKPFIERIGGVAEVNVYGGREREVRVLVDPQALAQRSLTYRDVIDALRAENQNISAGTIVEGKRDIRIRVMGQYANTEEVLDTPISSENGRLVLVRDVATVDVGYQKRRGFIRTFGQPSLAVNIIRQSGSNVVEIMEDLRPRLEQIRREILPNLHPTAGKHLRMRQVYDETTYIDSAIGLVTQNLWIGGLLAAGVLLIFLRSVISTGVVVLAIPISVVGTFLVLLATGRTLNVISLAGLAFAVGMVVDNAIVVLESIYQRIEKGENAKDAAYKGAREVWGAILASTLTTVAVFVPILTIQEEAGQLFRDLSLAIVASVVLSLIVSITVIPSACSRWLRPHSPKPNAVVQAIRTLFGLTTLLAKGTGAFVQAIRWLTGGWRGWTLRPAIIVLLTAASLVGASKLIPPLDYLPSGNRNLVFGGLAIPPGYSVEQLESIAMRIERVVKPYADADINEPSTVDALEPIDRQDWSDPSHQLEPFAPVPINNIFIGAFDGSLFVGATSQKPQIVIPIGQLVTNSMGGIPDVFGGASQAAIFGRGFGAGNSIDIEISGPDLARVTSAASYVYNTAGARYGFGQAVSSTPGNFNLQQQEYRIRLNENGRRLGLTTAEVGAAARSLFDGAFVDDYQYAGDTIDLVLLPSGGRLESKEQLAGISVTTPTGQRVSLATVVDFVPALSPQQISRIEELPSVTISVKPPNQQPVGELMDEIQTEIIAPARAQGMIDRLMRVRLEGTAAKLSEVAQALVGAPQDTQPNETLAQVQSLRGWQRTLAIFAAAPLVVGLLCSVVIAVRASLTRDWSKLYGGAGAIILGVILALVLLALATQPQLATARLVWALLVTFLLMAALFESFLYPFVILFSVPLAIVGGFAGLRLVHDASLADPTKPIQQLDVLTMIGFIILIGVVVNNAILLVDRSLSLIRASSDEQSEPLPIGEAVAQAVRSRIRPIFMSVLTSVGGMLPLVLMPGAGSEMYRGLGSVVVGGLLVSTVFTLLLVPLLLSLTLEMREAAAGVLSSLWKRASVASPYSDG